MIADGNTPLGCGTSSRRAGTRALPDLHPANAQGLEMLSGYLWMSLGTCVSSSTEK